MQITTFDEGKRELASRYMTQLVFHGGNDKLTADGLVGDKRKRAKLFRELCEAGYIARESDSAQEGVVTSKAFDEVPVEFIDLASMFTFDRFDSDKGKVWVSWNRLTFGQKKAVVVAVQANPATFTLMMTEPRYSPPKVAEFQLGGGAEAGGSDGSAGWGGYVFVVTNDGVKAKDRAGRRELYMKNTRESGLNWYLQKAKLLEPEEEVPLQEKSPSFFGNKPGINCDPQHWEAGVTSTQKEIKDDINDLRKRLAVLEKFEQLVDRLGGWKVFIADYESACGRYVDELMAKEDAAK